MKVKRLRKQSKAIRLLESEHQLKAFIDGLVINRKNIKYSYSLSKSTRSIYITFKLNDSSISLRLSDHNSNKNIRYLYIGSTTKVYSIERQIIKILDQLEVKDVITTLGRI